MNESTSSEINSSICDSDIISYHKVKTKAAASLLNDLAFWHEKHCAAKDNVLFKFDDTTSHIISVSQFVLLARSKWYRNCSKRFKKQNSPDVFNIFDEDENCLVELVKSDGDCFEFKVKHVSRSIFLELSALNFLLINIPNFIWLFFSVFKARYLYTSNCDVANDTAMDLLQCAIAFQVNSLVQNLCDYLCRAIEKDFSVNEVIRLYSMSTQYKHTDLLAKCRELIKRSAKVVVNTSEWKCLETKKPQLVISAFYTDVKTVA